MSVNPSASGSRSKEGRATYSLSMQISRLVNSIQKVSVHSSLVNTIKLALELEEICFSE
jgi:hypothetical protein